MKHFVSTYGISSKAEWVDRSPNMAADDEWNRSANHYKVTLISRKLKSQITTHFSMGSAHTKAPEAEDVLNALASDSSSIENNADFESWAREFGYDTDLRKAEKTFKACLKQAEELKRFLGEDAYKELLWETESL